MRIVLVRHAEAVSAGDGLDDAARYLSEEGRSSAQRVAEAVAGKGLVPAIIVASPRLRTQQTAEIFARELGFEGPIQIQASLCYTADAAVAARELRARSGVVFAFGHMPTLPETGRVLCAGKGVRGFTLSQAVLIEGGRVTWSIEP